MPLPSWMRAERSGPVRARRSVAHSRRAPRPAGGPARLQRIPTVRRTAPVTRPSGAVGGPRRVTDQIGVPRTSNVASGAGVSAGGCHRVLRTLVIPGSLPSVGACHTPLRFRSSPDTRRRAATGAAQRPRHRRARRTRTTPAPQRRRPCAGAARPTGDVAGARRAGAARRPAATSTHRERAGWGGRIAGRGHTSDDRAGGQVVHVERVGASVRILRIGRPEGFDFEAGQYLNVGVAGSPRRSLSLASAPDDPDLELCVELVPGGRVTPMLFRLGVGDRRRAVRRRDGVPPAWPAAADPPARRHRDRHRAAAEPARAALAMVRRRASWCCTAPATPMSCPTRRSWPSWPGATIGSGTCRRSADPARYATACGGVRPAGSRRSPSASHHGLDPRARPVSADGQLVDDRERPDAARRPWLPRCHGVVPLTVGRFDDQGAATVLAAPPRRTRTGRPTRTSTPGDHSTCGSPTGSVSPAAVTSDSSSDTTAASCKDHRGCSTGAQRSVPRRVAEMRPQRPVEEPRELVARVDRRSGANRDLRARARALVRHRGAGPTTLHARRDEASRAVLARSAGSPMAHRAHAVGQVVGPPGDESGEQTIDVQAEEPHPTSIAGTDVGAHVDLGEFPDVGQRRPPRHAEATHRERDERYPRSVAMGVDDDTLGEQALDLGGVVPASARNTTSSQRWTITGRRTGGPTIGGSSSGTSVSAGGGAAAPSEAAVVATGPDIGRPHDGTATTSITMASTPRADHPTVRTQFVAASRAVTTGSWPRGVTVRRDLQPHGARLDHCEQGEADQAAAHVRAGRVGRRQSPAPSRPRSPSVGPRPSWSAASAGPRSRRTPRAPHSRTAGSARTGRTR